MHINITIQRHKIFMGGPVTLYTF